MKFRNTASIFALAITASINSFADTATGDVTVTLDLPPLNSALGEVLPPLLPPLNYFGTERLQATPLTRLTSAFSAEVYPTPSRSLVTSG